MATESLIFKLRHDSYFWPGSQLNGQAVWRHSQSINYLYDFGLVCFDKGLTWFLQHSFGVLLVAPSRETPLRKTAGAFDKLGERVY